MTIEHEVRVMIDDINEFLEKIVSESFRYCTANFQKRFVYDLKPAVKGRWIRLRTDGVKTTITYKEIVDKGIISAKEVEVGVDNFETMNEFLGKLGFLPRSYQENFRIHYKKDDTSLDIDYWPGMRPYFEIEAPDDDKVIELLSLLNINKDAIITQNVDKMYQSLLGIDLDKTPQLKFSDDEIKSLNKLMEILTNAQ